MTATTVASPRPAYRRWALALLGALLLIAVSQITTVVPDEAATSTSPDDLEVTLGGMTLIEQTFTTTRADLVGLRVRLRPGEADAPDLSIPIHLRYSDGPAIDMVSASLAAENAEGGMASIRFPPLVASRDPYLVTGTLRLILDIPAIPPGTGPLITVSRGPAARGGLIIDGIPQPGADLAITPLYQIRWVDRIWPISAMAAGKPGLLGQPPFYALLAYLYILGIGAGIAALRRAHLAEPEDTSPG